MSAGTMVAIWIVAVLASGYIGWLFGFKTAAEEAQAAHDLVAVLREGLAAAHKLNEEQFTARYEAGITDALAAVRQTRSQAGVKAAVTRAMRKQVQVMVDEVADATEEAA